MTKMRGLYLLLLFSNFFRCSIAKLIEPNVRDSLTFPVQSQEAELKDSVTFSLFSLTWLAVSASLVALLLSMVQSNAVVKVKQLFSNFQFQRLVAEFIIYALSDQRLVNLSSVEESDVDAGICNSDAHQQSESKPNNSTHDSLTELDDGYIKSRREANQAKPIKMKKIVLFADHNPQQAGNESLANLSDKQTSLKPNIGKLRGFSLHQPLDNCPLEDDAEEILNTKDYPGVSWSQVEGRAAVQPICSPMDGKDTGLPPKSILCLPLPKVGAIRLGRHGRSVLEVDWVVPPPKKRSSFTRHHLLNW